MPLMKSEVVKLELGQELRHAKDWDRLEFLIEISNSLRYGHSSQVAR